MPDGTLVFAPGKGDFECPYDHRQADEPIEIIVPCGVQYFVEEIVEVALVAIK